MRKSMRKAKQLEAKIQALTTIKVNGTIDEKQYARRKLSDSLTSRYIPAERFSKACPTIEVLGGRKVL